MVPENIHTHPIEGHWKFRGGGVSTVQIFRGKLNWKILEGGRIKLKTFHGGGMDIFWNHTLCGYLQRNSYVFINMINQLSWQKTCLHSSQNADVEPMFTTGPAKVIFIATSSTSMQLSFNFGEIRLNKNSFCQEIQKKAGNALKNTFKKRVRYIPMIHLENLTLIHVVYTCQQHEVVNNSNNEPMSPTTLCFEVYMYNCSPPRYALIP